MKNVEIIEQASWDLMQKGIIKPVQVGEITVPEPIHTYQAWKTLGYQVRKGEKAIAKFCIWKHVSAKKDADEEDNEAESGPGDKMFMKMSSFFTAGQVDPIETEESAS